MGTCNVTLLRGVLEKLAVAQLVAVRHHLMRYRRSKTTNGINYEMLQQPGVQKSASAQNKLRESASIWEGKTRNLSAKTWTGRNL